ncbi:MAG: TetR/AcrR family transcriptional regulator [Rhodospirillaceae bacterium]|jgi:TetR/AcrR family transcriptional regulator, transcriptional repressor for nem operon|nr:TetR/AcrR family transcriptional regulator [Rhodospirillaceae bacterium]
MPKIAAPTVEEHVAQQRGRILTEALRLFQAKGYLGVDIGSVARSVGLKRSSFYHYFANKDDLLIACVEHAMEPVDARNKVIAEGLRPPRDRVLAWVEAQMDFATGPDHASYELAKELQAVAPNARKKVLRLHIRLYKTLSAAVADSLEGSGRNAVTIASMISGMVQSAAALALENGGVESITAELRSGVLAVLESASHPLIKPIRHAQGRAQT